MFHNQKEAERLLSQLHPQMSIEEFSLLCSKANEFLDDEDGQKFFVYLYKIKRQWEAQR